MIESAYEKLFDCKAEGIPESTMLNSIVWYSRFVMELNEELEDELDLARMRVAIYKEAARNLAGLLAGNKYTSAPRREGWYWISPAPNIELSAVYISDTEGHECRELDRMFPEAVYRGPICAPKDLRAEGQ